MATIFCPGGHSFSDGQVPSPYAWTLLSDIKLDDAMDEIISKTRAGEDIDAQIGVIIGSYGWHAYVCPECKRLLVFENGFENAAVSYRRE